MPGADQRMKNKSYCALTSRSARRATIASSGDQDTLGLEVAEDTPQPAVVAERGRTTLSVDEFLAARLTPPPGVGPVSLQDMDRAIAEGASGRGSL
jgi:hypothetical protein